MKRKIFIVIYAIFTMISFPVANLLNLNFRLYKFSQEAEKNWAQRLQWFESKIINYYKNLNKKNILVIGDQKFLYVFKSCVEKYNWTAQFTYSQNINNFEAINFYDLIIDAQYDLINFQQFFNASNISLFEDVYTDVLYTEATNFFKENNIKYYFFEAPIECKIKNLDSFEQYTAKFSGIEYSNLYSHPDFIKNATNNNAEVVDFIINRKRLANLYNDGICIKLKNVTSESYNVINNERFTTDVPDSYKNNIYFLGPCIIEGDFVPDKYTLPSYFQRDCNKDNLNYRAVNFGVSGVDELNEIERILRTNLKKGDIIVFLRSEYSKNSKKYIEKLYETSHLFSRPHNHGHWMLDMFDHITHTGNEVIANYVYTILKSNLNNSEQNESDKKIIYKFENNVDTFIDDHPEFKEYLDNLKDIAAKNNVNGVVGSLNMNANPFTLGHRYLVEEALKYVDHLYLFVVEEDRSDFSFKDRYEMIKRGVSDLKNVTVLTTGQWMCSYLTFPDYFDKENLQDKKLDPTMDIDLYGKYIAPAIKSTKRFTGEEPFDLITRQHNKFMKEQLPKYGIQFYEFPRKNLENGEVISATTVRKLFKNKDFENLKKYVPQTTLDYLKENYDKIVKK